MVGLHQLMINYELMFTKYFVKVCYVEELTSCSNCKVLSTLSISCFLYIYLQVCMHVFVVTFSVSRVKVDRQILLLIPRGKFNKGAHNTIVSQLARNPHGLMSAERGEIILPEVHLNGGLSKGTQTTVINLLMRDRCQ